MRVKLTGRFCASAGRQTVSGLILRCRRPSSKPGRPPASSIYPDIAAGKPPQPDISLGKRRLIKESDFNSTTFGLSYLIGHVRGSALMTQCHSNGRVCRADQIKPGLDRHSYVIG